LGLQVGSARNGRQAAQARSAGGASSHSSRKPWNLFASVGLAPDEHVEQSELLSTLQTAIGEVLTPHQRRVLVALALNDVPIDVLADRLDTTRGALYKTLHDAHQKLRACLAERELSLATAREP
jgi:RNA polymerase sigma-70 factor, ECF subfamily